MAATKAKKPPEGKEGGDWHKRLKWITAAVPILAAVFGIFTYLRIPASAGAPTLIAVGGIILLASGWQPPWPRRHGRAFLVIVIFTAIAAVPAVIFSSPSSRAFMCSARTCYDFAGGTTQGWEVRIENGVPLGTKAIATDDPHVGRQRGALAFYFHIGAPPTDKAQIQIGGVRLTEQLSAWVYVPSGTPRTLELFAFVLEHNTGGEPGKPEWPFYKTKTVALQTGSWTQVTFAVSDFVGVNTNLTWSNPPLLFGFEIHPTKLGDFDGIVYFDHISVT